MNILPINVQKLIQLFQKIPGLGPKSAARIAMFLLKSPKSFSKDLGKIIQDLTEEVVYCQKCFNIASSSLCDLCNNPERDKSLLCVVEDPLDVLAFENGTNFDGLYHVLGGVISPVNGIGPEDLTIDELVQRVKKEEMKEITIATNPNIEGEATAMYIKEEIEKLSIKGLKITRLARGLPTGADLEYADKTTLMRSFEGRTKF